MLLNLILNVGYKQGKISKTWSKKWLKFVLYSKNNTIVLNLNLILLLIEVDLILEEWSYKKEALMDCDISRVKIIVILSIEVEAL